MKGCFILQRRFVYIGHEIAQQLMAQGSMDAACAYVQGRDGLTFLTEQNTIAYSELLLDEDIHNGYRDEVLDLEYLRALEKRVGIPTLWQYINPDRIVRSNQLVREYPYDTPQYSHEDMLRMVQVHAKRIEAFLDAEKPDFLFTAQPGAIGTVLLYHLARERGIKTLVVMFPGVEESTCLSERYDRLTFVEESVERHRTKSLEQVPCVKEATTFIKSFRTKPRSYSQVYDAVPPPIRSAHFRFLLPQRLVQSVKVLFDVYATWKTQRRDYTAIHPVHHIIDRVRRKVRVLVGSDDFYEPVPSDASFAFFPLHLEPEVALTLLSPFLSDQLVAVRLAAQSLPVGYKLVVKEHPQMAGFRPRSFFRELRKIPNVIVANPHVRALDIIPRADLIITIAGTAGFESTLLKKPVVTFGETFYEALSFVKRSDVPSELPALIRSQLDDFRFDDEELTRFVAAILEESARADVPYLWTLESDTDKKKQGLAPFVQLVAHKIKSVDD